MGGDTLMDLEREREVVAAWDAVRIGRLRMLFDRLGMPRAPVASWAEALPLLEAFADDLAHAERAAREQEDVGRAAAHADLRELALPRLMEVR